MTGTVFNEKVLSFPDVRFRIRHTSEKKFRWETYTNWRGEFAVRVPEGNEYEVWVQARNFKEQSQTRKVDAGAQQPQLSFRPNRRPRERRETINEGAPQDRLHLGGYARIRIDRQRAELQERVAIADGARDRHDKSETCLRNSVVFLENLRTNAVRSSFADSDGNYRFSGSDPNVDYEVHVELEGAKSKSQDGVVV